MYNEHVQCTMYMYNVHAQCYQLVDKEREDKRRDSHGDVRIEKEREKGGERERERERE